MKNNIWIIMKKEFARFFGDRRVLFTSLIMPGLLLYLIYSVMGSALSNIGHDAVGGEALTVYASNLPVSVAARAEQNGLDILPAAPEELDSVREDIENMQKGLLLVFPADFEPSETAQVEIYYNSASPESSGLCQAALAVLNGYQTVDLARPEDAPGGNFLAGMLPMLLMVFFFSSCLAVAPESIAGEKERGTIATLLVTPIRSWQLAAGKILSLAVMALLCGLSSALGAVLGLSRMLSFAGETLNIGGDPREYLLLLLIVLSTIGFMITLVSIISAYSKSVKEASTAAMPLLFVSVMVGFLPLLTSNAGNELYYYCIPLYNGARCLNELVSMDYSLVNILVAFVSNIAYACIGSFALAKMFRSERIIMTK